MTKQTRGRHAGPPGEEGQPDPAGTTDASTAPGAAPGTIPGSGARPPGRSGRPVYGAIDLGTNNCRLLIARKSYDGLRIIDAFSRLVRLGDALDPAGHLPPAAMDRTVGTLAACAEKIRRRGVGRYRAVATAACRAAVNHADLTARVRAETGLELEVITGAEEARLAFAGCKPLIDPLVTRVLVFDIGGGSTEFIWADSDDPAAPRILDRTSLEEGVASLTRRLGGNRIDPARYDAMVTELVERLSEFDARNGIARRIAEEGGVQILGASGTVTTITAVSFDLPRYIRQRVDGADLPSEEARRVASWLRSRDFDARAAHPCIGTARADMVVAGCAMMEAILTLWPAGRLRIADRGVREGILHDLIEAENHAAAPAKAQPDPATELATDGPACSEAD